MQPARLSRWKGETVLRKLSYCHAGKLSPCSPELLLSYLTPGERIVEIGSGAGILLAELTAHGFRAAGVEPDADRVGLCRAAGLTVFQGAAEALPLEDECCDCAIMECVYSLCEAKPARAELLRVLRPGGTLLLADLFAEQPLPADATRAALVGRLSTKAQLEAEFQQDFFLTDFCNLTQSLRQYLLQQMLFGGGMRPQRGGPRLPAQRQAGVWIMDLEKKLTRLQRTLQYARTHSQFYAALPETQPQTLADYTAFPMLTADDLLLHGAELLCCPPSRVRRIVSLETSGTSGARKRIFFTERDLEATVDFFHHGMDAVAQARTASASSMPGTNPARALRPAFARHPALRRCAAVLRTHSRRGRLRALVSGKPRRNAGRDPISGAPSGAAALGAAGSKRAALLGLRLPLHSLRRSRAAGMRACSTTTA